MDLASVDHLYIFFFILPLVAFMYASVGHGGASGYLALMAIFGFSPLVMKPTALLLNLFVAAVSFYHYWRSGHFKMKLFWPFAITSIPLSFIGGLIEIEALVYKKILAVLLVFAILKITNIIGRGNNETRELKIWLGIFIGAFIGFFSGLIGIGGGIILSPIILLMRWGKIKEAAAVSALFIWVNSAAGISGQFAQGVKINNQAFLLVAIALTGGFLGAYLGSKKFNNRVVRYMLAFVLVIACFKLLYA